MDLLYRFTVKTKETDYLARVELESLVAREAERIELLTSADAEPPLPYCLGRTQSPKSAIRVCEQAVLVRDLWEMLAAGPSEAKCLAQLEGKVLNTGKSWRLDVERYGAPLKKHEKDGIRRRCIDTMRFQGEVSLVDPEERYLLIDYQEDTFVVIARRLAISKKRELITASNLRTRVFLGPTALDNELALVMANLGKCRPHAVVLDPYCGTGSILVACALLGSQCFGTDIDWKVLKGKSMHQNDGAMHRRGPSGERGTSAKPPLPIAAFGSTEHASSSTQKELRKTIFSNFRQYNLQLPEIIRLDASRFDHHFLAFEAFDAIITDPPYGIRAGARCSASVTYDHPISPDIRPAHIPKTRPYPVADVLADLLILAARALVPNGILVYLLPATPEFSPETDAPKHPAFTLTASAPQTLNSRYSRFIITMTKHRHWRPSDADPALRDQTRATILPKFMQLQDAIWRPAEKSPSPQPAEEDSNRSDANLPPA